MSKHLVILLLMIVHMMQVITLKKVNELLGRPLIKIYQDPELFSFSLDSMLLADFATKFNQLYADTKIVLAKQD